MTTAEKINVGVAIAGAVGLGALLKSFLDHVLARREKRVDLAEKSIRVADAMMTRMQADLDRAHTALERRSGKATSLGARLAELAPGEDRSARLDRALDELDQAGADISALRDEMAGRPGRGLGRGLAALIPDLPDSIITRARAERGIADSSTDSHLKPYRFDGDDDS